MSLRLEIRIDGYWISSSGRGQGYLHDAETVLDVDGFPYLPGRHLRGLLREAVRLLDDWGAVEPGALSRLFGEGGRAAAQRGGLTVTNAELAPALRGAIERPETLFDTLSLTRMNAAGVADTGSLRVLRVALPMTLWAELDWAAAEATVSDGEEPWDWKAVVTEALPLIRAVGAHRNRGLGRALVTAHPVAGAA
jgi:hypothetical protein